MEGQFHAFDFRGAGVTIERLEGIDGAANVPAWLRPEFAGPHQLTSAEVGCYASHLTVAQNGRQPVPAACRRPGGRRDPRRRLPAGVPGRRSTERRPAGITFTCPR